MNFRTDLALEKSEINESNAGIEQKISKFGNLKVTKITVLNEEGEKAVGKQKGKYITVEGLNFSNYIRNDDEIEYVSKELLSLIKGNKNVLISGLGNVEITPDSLGPKCLNNIFVTRHISKEISESIGLGELNPVSTITPGVLGNTGIETAEIVLGIKERIKPSLLLVIDALASRRLSRIGTTLQISDTGIFPGSGVGNRRWEISENTIGVPVISIGVPTVVDVKNIIEEYNEIEDEMVENMMVTPRDIDTVIKNASFFIGMIINKALQPNMNIDEIIGLLQ